MKVAVIIACLGACQLVSGCASPTAHLYTLMPSEPRSTAVPAANSHQVVLESVTLPETVDRPELLVRVGPNRVAALEQERWAEPLHEAIPRVIRECLSNELPDATVFAGSETSKARPDVSITVEIVRIESVPGQSVLIEARAWLRTRRDAAPVLVHSVARGRVQGAQSDYGALVAAHVAALQMLSTDLATAIRSALGAGGGG